MLRKPTQSGRATVTQEFRFIVLPEDDAPGAERQVTLLTPASPDIVFVVTPHEMLTDKGEPITVNTPRELGLNRHYRGIQLPNELQLPIKLQSHQGIIAATVAGQGALGVIIEYSKEDKSP